MDTAPPWIFTLSGSNSISCEELKKRILVKRWHLAFLDRVPPRWLLMFSIFIFFLMSEMIDVFLSSKILCVGLTKAVGKINAHQRDVRIIPPPKFVCINTTLYTQDTISYFCFLIRICHVSFFSSNPRETLRACHLSINLSRITKSLIVNAKQSTLRKGPSTKQMKKCSDGTNRDL